MQEGTTIYFVRHGKTYLNKYNYMQGWANAPLTPEGSAIVHASGRGLSNVKFDAVYTSDLARTRDTARIILQENLVTDPNIDIIQMPEFREVFFGSYEGQDSVKAYDQVAKHNGYESADDMRKQLDNAQIMNAFSRADRSGDAENFSAFWHRVESGLIQLVQKHRDTEDTILLVAHGAAIHYIIENIIPDFKATHSLENASVSKVRYYDGQFRLDYYGRTDHFLLEE
ncbi:MAG: histidine phosphatase family protein [Aerococcus sp.]|nr:histidine phosphatase family protein [Aerococcus sp.]